MKVFVFCVGGTGLRVMKSIIMMAAAGADFRGYSLVPIIVDPHLELEERKNLQSLIQDYNKLHEISIKGTGMASQALNALDGFFGTPLLQLSDIDAQNNPTSDQNSYQRTFRQFMKLSNLDVNDPANYLVQTLFSEKSLSDSLSVGFKGNPNVGTVVLGEQLRGASWYDSFQRVFSAQEGDRIFIISSIFGGTGASGYPLIEKRIKEDTTHPGIQNALLGAVSVLPYFKLTDPDRSRSSIDSANFITKTKAALSYYEGSVKADYFYYAGDHEMRANYENSEKDQKDKANFIELVAASALLDFLKREKPTETQYMTRALKENKDSLNLADLGDAYAPIVKDVLNLEMLRRLVVGLPEEKHFPLSQSLKLDSKFYNDNDFKCLKAFTDRFDLWLKELGSNNRSFSPLKSVSNNHLSDIVDGRTLEAKNITYYLLKMIESGSTIKAPDNDFRLRYLLDVSYKAIKEYTSKISK
jgi:hypothetical protein